jgi:16S rRNA (uracil1498-N3)-methyltransferase
VRPLSQLPPMTDPLFLDELTVPLPLVGTQLLLAGDEGRHAAAVRRIRPGEMIMIGDGRGRGIRGLVVEMRPSGLIVEVADHLVVAQQPRRVIAAQALAKGDRSELAVEMMTEMGISEIIPWQASRSIVRWSEERAARSLTRWRSTVREAAKQSRRLTLPEVSSKLIFQQPAPC